MLNRRQLLLSSSAVALAAALPFPAIASLPVRNYPVGRALDAQLINQALGFVKMLWYYPPLHAGAFGYPQYTIATEPELRLKVQWAAMEEGDALMWTRILTWLQIKERLEARYGKHNLAAHRRWATKSTLPGRDVMYDYLLNGTEANLRSALRFLEAA